METFSALLALCAGNSPVTGEFSAQRPVTWSFDVFFDLHLNKRSSKQSRGWWSETPPRSSWRQCIGWSLSRLLLWMNTFPDSNVGWANVGPTSGRQYRRWVNVGPTYIAVWDCLLSVGLFWKLQWMTSGLTNREWDLSFRLYDEIYTCIHKHTYHHNLSLDREMLMGLHHFHLRQLKPWTLFSLLLCSLWWVQIIGYVLSWRSYSFLSTLHHLIIIIAQTNLKTLN